MFSIVSDQYKGRDGLCAVPFFSLLWGPEMISRTAQKPSLSMWRPGTPRAPRRSARTGGFATRSRALSPASQIPQASQSATPFTLNCKDGAIQPRPTGRLSSTPPYYRHISLALGAASLPQPFTAPAVNPATIRYWNIITRMTSGMVTTMEAAMMAPHGCS
jgi:hypothetical protein